MANRLQIRRGPTDQTLGRPNPSPVGLVGEPLFDTDTNTLYIANGSNIPEDIVRNGLNQQVSTYDTTVSYALGTYVTYRPDGQPTVQPEIYRSRVNNNLNVLPDNAATGATNWERVGYTEMQIRDIVTDAQRGEDPTTVHLNILHGTIGTAITALDEISTGLTGQAASAALLYDQSRNFVTLTIEQGTFAEADFPDGTLLTWGSDYDATTEQTGGIVVAVESVALTTVPAPGTSYFTITGTPWPAARSIFSSETGNTGIRISTPVGNPLIGQFYTLGTEIRTNRGNWAIFTPETLGSLVRYDPTESQSAGHPVIETIIRTTTLPIEPAQGDVVLLSQDTTALVQAQPVHTQEDFHSSFDIAGGSHVTWQLEPFENGGNNDNGENAFGTGVTNGDLQNNLAYTQRNGGTAVADTAGQGFLDFTRNVFQYTAMAFKRVRAANGDTIPFVPRAIDRLANGFPSNADLMSNNELHALFHPGDRIQMNNGEYTVVDVINQQVEHQSGQRRTIPMVLFQGRVPYRRNHTSGGLTTIVDSPATRMNQTIMTNNAVRFVGTTGNNNVVEIVCRSSTYRRALQDAIQGTIADANRALNAIVFSDLNDDITGAITVFDSGNSINVTNVGDDIIQLDTGGNGFRLLVWNGSQTRFDNFYDGLSRANDGSLQQAEVTRSFNDAVRVDAVTSANVFGNGSLAALSENINNHPTTRTSAYITRRDEGELGTAEQYFDDDSGVAAKTYSRGDRIVVRRADTAPDSTDNIVYEVISATASIAAGTIISQRQAFDNQTDDFRIIARGPGLGLTNILNGYYDPTTYVDSSDVEALKPRMRVSAGLRIYDGNTWR